MIYDEALKQLIEKSMDGLDNAINFLQAEIPEVVHELLLWAFAYNLVKFLLFLGLVYLSCRIWMLLYKKAIADKYDDGSIYIGVGVVYSILALLPAAFLMNLVWLKVWIAPKLFLLEYAMELVKK